MDIYCPKCGEPVDNDYIHEYVAELGMPKTEASYNKLAAKYRSKGCVALGMKCSAPSTEVDRSFGLTRQAAASVLYDILGDDMDGAMMEDMGF